MAQTRHSCRLKTFFSLGLLLQKFHSPELCFDTGSRESGNTATMSIPQLGGATTTAGAALLCTVLSQYLSARPSELYSELLCWLTLPLLFGFVQRLETRTRPKTGALVSDFAVEHNFPSSHFYSSPSNAAWIVATGITIATFYKTEQPVIELFVSL